MKLSNVCMECHGEPESFEVEGGGLAYYMVFHNDDPVTLMSNLECVFTVCLTKEYQSTEEDRFVCINCFDKMTEEE